MKAIKAEVEGKEILLACEHWKTWPPLAATLEQSADELRAMGMASDTEHQRIQVWERICGLKVMNGGKCSTCPHVRKVTSDHTGLFLTTMDESKSSRIVDPTAQKTFRSSLQAIHRRPGTPGSGSNAAWIEVDNHGRD